MMETLADHLPGAWGKPLEPAKVETEHLPNTSVGRVEWNWISYETRSWCQRNCRRLIFDSCETLVTQARFSSVACVLTWCHYATDWSCVGRRGRS
jgi:hypothetical protein